MNPILCFVLLLFAAPVLAAEPAPQAVAPAPKLYVPLSQQPLRFAKEIAAFEAEDKVNPPPRDALLFSGASSLRLWKNLADEMKPYPVINRGFGGSYTTEVLGYMDRITLPYHPRVVVFHCGGNDINAGDSPEAPLQRIADYVQRLRKSNPNTAVVLMATTRAPSRRPKWPEMDTFNKGLAQYVRQTKNVSFVDINPALNQASGDGKEGHYLPDNLHPSELGYKAILKVLRPAVDAAWKNTQRAFAKSPK